MTTKNGWTEELVRKLHDLVYHCDYIVKCVYLDDPVVKLTVLSEVGASFEKYRTLGNFGCGSNVSDYDSDYDDLHSLEDYVPEDFRVFKRIKKSWTKEVIK